MRVEAPFLHEKTQSKDELYQERFALPPTEVVLHGMLEYNVNEFLYYV